MSYCRGLPSRSAACQAGRKPSAKVCRSPISSASFAASCSRATALQICAWTWRRSPSSCSRRCCSRCYASARRSTRPPNFSRTTTQRPLVTRRYRLVDLHEKDESDAWERADDAEQHAERIERLADDDAPLDRLIDVGRCVGLNQPGVARAAPAPIQGQSQQGQVGPIYQHG